MITTQTSLDRIFEPNVYLLTNFGAGAEANRVHHNYTCPHHSYNNTWEVDHTVFADCPGCHPAGPMPMLKTYVGCVLETYERNGSSDSDFFALVWDEESQSVKTIEYATTRGWTYANSAKVDATDEVKQKATQYFIKNGAECAANNSKLDAKIPSKGKECLVVKGRKVKKGQVVKVIGNPTTRIFGYNTRVESVLVQCEDRSMVSVNVENLEVINPEQYWRTPESFMDEMAHHANFVGNFRSMLYLGVPVRILSKIF